MLKYIKSPFDLSRKSDYLDLAIQAALPLQMQPWWLDAVCGPENWQLCLSYDRNGQVDGALPFYLLKRLGLSRIKMPPLTDYIGPWMRLPEDEAMKPERRSTLEQRILSKLVAQLPAVHFYSQQFFPSLDNWLPFYWQGYRQTTLYTYGIRDLSDLGAVYRDFKRTVRTDIKKAERSTVVEKGDDPAELFALYTASLRRQGLPPACTYADLQRLDQALQQKQQRQILLARDLENGQVVAGLYLVWDQQTSYFLLSGLEPAYRHLAAVHLLYWRALQEAAHRGQSVDFCGSILPGVEHLLRSYGAERMPHYRIFRARNRWWRLLALARGREA